ncbi:hypothetical protein ACFVQB_14000 [Paenibacillus sp. NPDC057886]|uniref:hypothetical protein n=1 Tax=Paenibacillus sp. NPDC057886 TaxID=3346270 RepID=UPI0036D12967
MDNSQLKELFYSKEMEQIRKAYYDEAYKQGKFDEAASKGCVEEVFDWQGDDFSVWKDKVWYSDKDQYHVGVEGYMGFEDMTQAIDCYEQFNEAFKQYIEQNCGLKEKHLGWHKIYSVRAVNVAYENECYWIFLDGHKSEEISDLYWYMFDVIEQLKQVNESL